MGLQGVERRARQLLKRFVCLEFQVMWRLLLEQRVLRNALVQGMMAAAVLLALRLRYARLCEKNDPRSYARMPLAQWLPPTDTDA